MKKYKTDHFVKGIVFLIFASLQMFLVMCNPKPDVHITTPSEQQKIDSIKQDSINKADSVKTDSVQIIHIDTLNP